MVVDEDGGLVFQAASMHEGVPLPVAVLLTRLTDVPQPFAQLLSTTHIDKVHKKSCQMLFFDTICCSFLTLIDTLR